MQYPYRCLLPSPTAVTGRDGIYLSKDDNKLEIVDRRFSFEHVGYSYRATEMEAALAVFGRQLGAAFQVADDVLDYTADAKKFGKNIGDDLAEGKPTLPLILSRKYLEPDQQSIIDETIRQGGVDRIDQIVELIRSSGALRESTEVARSHSNAAREAIASLPDSCWKDAMLSLASYSVSREF